MLTLAIIATPWILRGHLATTLDAQRDAAVHVLTEFDNEVQRQNAEQDQRETRHRRIRIENMLEKQAGRADADEAEQTAYNESVREEGVALLESVDAFEKMLAEISIAEADRLPLQAAAERARNAAEALKASYEEGEAGDALFKAFDEASEAYQRAFETLRDRADAAVDATGQWADYARIAAWLLTALGARSTRRFDRYTLLMSAAEPLHRHRRDQRGSTAVGHLGLLENPMICSSVNLPFLMLTHACHTP